MLLSVGLLASGITWEAPPVILISLVIFGSSVPLWLKFRKAQRLGSRFDTKGLEDRVGQQFMEAEDRDAQQFADIEQNTNRIADLEERLEFMERLLARQRSEDDGGERRLLGPEA
jgi:hypothetical protein